MPQDSYTRDKLKTLKKIYKTYNIPCATSDLRKYEEWVSINKDDLPWKDRWHNMLLYTRYILNSNYTWKDISVHEHHTLIETCDRVTRCKCKMCNDCYNPRGFMEHCSPNYKAYIDIHGLFKTPEPLNIQQHINNMNADYDKFNNIMKDINNGILQTNDIMNNLKITKEPEVEVEAEPSLSKPTKSFWSRLWCNIICH